MKFNVWDHYNERESWTCQYCNKEIDADNFDLMEHLKEIHNIEVEE